MSNIPVSYNFINHYNGARHPSTVHVSDTWTAAYFRRYLLQEFMSLFKFDLPKNWDKSYFSYTLFLWGYVAIFKSNKYGVIPQECSLTGYDIFYRPNTVVIENRLLRADGIKTFKINEDCALVKMSPDYGGIYDIIENYGDQLALTLESFSVNMLNSKLAYVFTAGNKAAAETFKKLYDKISSGEPAVVVDKSLQNANGELPLEMFSKDVKGSYIANDVLDAMRKIKVNFYNDIGIPNVNTDKAERLIVDEVNANNIETSTKFTLWLNTIRDGFEKANEMFNLNLSVNPTFERSVNNDTFNTGIV